MKGKILLSITACILCLTSSFVFADYIDLPLRANNNYLAYQGWEDVANASIAIPEPATIVLLAIGPFIFMLKRRKSHHL